MKKHKKKNYLENVDEIDELRARFTVWLDTTVYRAKLKYLNKTKQNLEVVFIDDIPEALLGLPEAGFDSVLINEREFNFEEEKLARAYAELSLMRKEILRLLFVEEMQPAEIASRMNCSIQHIYNQRSLAVKKLRDSLLKGEYENEKG